MLCSLLESDHLMKYILSLPSLPSPLERGGMVCVPFPRGLPSCPQERQEPHSIKAASSHATHAVSSSRGHSCKETGRSVPARVTAQTKSCISLFHTLNSRTKTSILKKSHIETAFTWPTESPRNAERFKERGHQLG